MCQISLDNLCRCVPVFQTQTGHRGTGHLSCHSSSVKASATFRASLWSCYVPLLHIVIIIINIKIAHIIIAHWWTLKHTPDGCRWDLFSLKTSDPGGPSKEQTSTTCLGASRWIRWYKLSLPRQEVSCHREQPVPGHPKPLVQKRLIQRMVLPELWGPCWPAWQHTHR